jgi:hypothetical protein
MDSSPQGRSEQELLAQVEGQLLAAGFTYILRNSDRKVRCDLICYGTMSDETFAVAAVVEVKASANKQSRDLAAPGLLIAKSDFDAEHAYLITPDEIWQASESSLSLERLSSIPKLSKTLGIVRSKQIAVDLITRLLDRGRGQSDIEISLTSLLSNLEIEAGNVNWSKPKTQIDGQVFLEAYLELLNKLRGLHGVAQATSSPKINLLFSLLARWFPQSSQLFDPTAGFGGTLASAAKGITDNPGSQGQKIKALGFEMNATTVDLATKMSQLITSKVEASFEKTDSLETPWPACDLLVSDPPLGLYVGERQREEYPNPRTIEDYIVYKSAEGIVNGTIRHGAIILTGRGWLSNGGSSARIRDYLAENGLVRALIGVPALNNATSMKLVAVVLGRGSQESVLADLGDDWESHLTGEVGDLRDLINESFRL